ncbi:unnamed protein product [Mytilus edulis]|uniref:Chitin-binding type-4 domain-containing protein n=1 Tax=Mytilus edulis TaxID=6550 RepID=A0A8S3Q277_MYTED|nr:unnamed protein product [Mytilus edulis]
MDKLTLVQFLLCIGTVWGHGRMIEPPMRSSMWRYGFKTPKNYNDNELNCGGFAKMMDDGGRCGPCGDPWISPRNNEAGGKYATGTIARHYATGQIINVTVELTSNHKGYYEFRLCPNNNPSRAVTQECLNRNVLNIMGHGKRYVIDSPDSNLFMEFQLSLPPGLSCSQCVLQWKWRAAQNKGSNGHGGECFGCGPQEHFINCADVSIGSRANVLPLNRPGQRGVFISKTGPKMNVIHSPSKTTSAPKQPVQRVYDASVMEPPVDSYSNNYLPTSSNAQTSNNYQPTRSNAQSSNNYQPTRSNAQSSNNYRSNNYQPKNLNVQNSNNYQQRNSNTQRSSNTGRRSGTSQNKIYVYQREKSPQEYRNNHQTQRKSFNQHSPISKQVSYDKMLDSKNQITAMVLQYVSSLPMDTAMESGMIECDGFIRPVCKAVPLWNNNRPFDEWCSVLCPTGVCPAAVCSCSCPPKQNNRQNNAQYAHEQQMKCRSMTSFGDQSMDRWCTITCNSNPDNCPSDHCWCDGL